MIKLSNCKEGDRVLVASIVGPNHVKLRLLEMGFTTGSEIKVIRYAPLKGPVELLVKQSRICLRRGETNCILVTRFNTETSNTK